RRSSLVRRDQLWRVLGPANIARLKSADRTRWQNVAGAIRARTLPVLRRSTAAPRKVAVTHSRPSDEAMSAFGDKADMTIALRMSKADITSLVSPRARPSSEGQLISVRWRIQSRGRP